jgi:hypothetical protein
VIFCGSLNSYHCSFSYIEGHALDFKKFETSYAYFLAFLTAAAVAAMQGREFAFGKHDGSCSDKKKKNTGEQ